VFSLPSSDCKGRNMLQLPAIEPAGAIQIRKFSETHSIEPLYLVASIWRFLSIPFHHQYFPFFPSKCTTILPFAFFPFLCFLLPSRSIDRVGSHVVKREAMHPVLTSLFSLFPAASYLALLRTRSITTCIPTPDTNCVSKADGKGNLEEKNSKARLVLRTPYSVQIPCGFILSRLVSSRLASSRLLVASPLVSLVRPRIPRATRLLVVHT
jgi:hypothetical protein